MSGAKCHAAEPGGERVVHPDRARLAHEDQKRGLERVVRVVMMPQDLSADPQHHRPVAIDELTERRFGLASLGPERPRTDYRSWESLSSVSVPDAQSTSSGRPASPAFLDSITIRLSRVTDLPK